MAEEYPDFFKSTGYGTGEGLCGWNCRHSFFPFYPGISKPHYTAEALAALNEKDIEYRGKKYTRYEISQMQRALERQVRAAKRKCLAEEAAGLDATAAAAELKAARQQLAAFVKDTGGKENAGRTLVPGFGREQAEKSNEMVKGLTGAADGGTLGERAGQMPTLPVTKESLLKIQPLPSTLLDVAGQQQLANAHRRLLAAVAAQPPGTEAARIYDMKMRPLCDMSIGPPGGHKVGTPRIDVPHVLIHNHPSGMTFSFKDIHNFFEIDSRRVMTVVGNNGAVYMLEKAEGADIGSAKAFWDERKRRFGTLSSAAEIDRYIQDILEGMKEYGVSFFTTADS